MWALFHFGFTYLWVYYCNLRYTMPYGAWTSILLAWEARPASELLGSNCVPLLWCQVAGLYRFRMETNQLETYGAHMWSPSVCFESEKGRGSRKPCRPQHDGRQSGFGNSNTVILGVYHHMTLKHETDLWMLALLEVEEVSKSQPYTNLGSLHERKPSYIAVLQTETHVLDFNFTYCNSTSSQ